MQKNNLLIDYIQNNLASGINSNFINIDTGVQKNLSEVHSNSNKIANNLNIQYPDKVMVVLPNSIEFIEILIGVFINGSIFCPVPYFLEKQEFKKLIGYVKPALIITDRIDLENEYGNETKFLSYAQIIESSKVIKRSQYKIKAENVASLYYSSGTTGNPKGVLYSHKNISSLINSIVKKFQFNKNDRHLTMLPFGHTASINYNILPSLMTGGDLYITSGFEKIRTNFFSTISKYEITYTQIVPTILFLLNKLNINVNETNLKKLKYIGCGSSVLPLSSQKEFIDKYGIKISNLYGLSETGPSHFDNPLEKDWIPGSIGHPLDVNECKISDDGEMMLKGENIFVGYHNNDDLYKKTVVDGWFYTGDICQFKDKKYWYLDRKKDLIIKSGINIQPSEVEEVIYETKDVLECGVISIPDEIQGEKIIAIIIKTKNANKESLKELIKIACKKKLSNYKIPSEIVFWEALPKTLSKKISRKKIRDKYLSS